MKILNGDLQSYEKYMPKNWQVLCLHVFLGVISCYGFFCAISAHTKIFDVSVWVIGLISCSIAIVIQLICIQYKISPIELIAILMKKEEREKLDVWSIFIHIFAIVILCFVLYIEISVSIEGTKSAEQDLKEIVLSKTAPTENKTANSLQAKAAKKFSRDSTIAENTFAAKAAAIKNKFAKKESELKTKIAAAGGSPQWKTSLQNELQSIEISKGIEISKAEEEKASAMQAAAQELSEKEGKAEGMQSEQTAKEKQRQNSEVSQLSNFGKFFQYLIAGLYFLLVILEFIKVLIFKKTGASEDIINLYGLRAAVGDLFFSVKSVVVGLLQRLNKFILSFAKLQPVENKIALHDSGEFSILSNKQSKQIGLGYSAKNNTDNTVTLSMRDFMDLTEHAKRNVHQQGKVNQIRNGKTGSRPETTERNISFYAEKKEEIIKLQNKINGIVTLF